MASGKAFVLWKYGPIQPSAWSFAREAIRKSANGGILISPSSASTLTCSVQTAIKLEDNSAAPIVRFGPQAVAEGLSELDLRWQKRAIALIGPASGSRLPFYKLQHLLSLTEEHYTALPKRLKTLHQLYDVFCRLMAASATDLDLSEVADTIESLLLQRYLAQISTPAATGAWLHQLRRRLEPQERLGRFLRYCNGETLEAIGAASTPAVTREAVRISISPIAASLDDSPRQIARQVADHREEGKLRELASLLQESLERIGRFPFHTDGPDEFPLCCSRDMKQRLEDVAKLSLNRRLELHDSLAITVPEAEWALHLRVIAANEEEAGTGYWHREECLRQFLHRYAVELGAPGLMPKQKQLPAAVKGAVQRFGGQSAVATRVGLQYQGQLVGDDGRRTYWTETRLISLLEQTVVHANLAADAMPSRPQIAAFLCSGVVPEYRDKQPPSVFAALSRQNTLSWPQVAERFRRVPQGCGALPHPPLSGGAARSCFCFCAPARANSDSATDCNASACTPAETLRLRLHRPHQGQGHGHQRCGRVG